MWKIVVVGLIGLLVSSALAPTAVISRISVANSGVARLARSAHLKHVLSAGLVISNKFPAPSGPDFNDVSRAEGRRNEKLFAENGSVVSHHVAQRLRHKL